MAPKNLWWAKLSFKSSFMLTDGCLALQKVGQIQFGTLEIMWRKIHISNRNQIWEESELGTKFIRPPTLPSAPNSLLAHPSQIKGILNDIPTVPWWLFSQIPADLHWWEKIIYLIITYIKTSYLSFLFLKDKATLKW